MAACVVELDEVCIVFGAAPETALSLMDAGESREAIREQTGQVLGVHNCCLQVAEGEIVVLMGLSGSGKSTLLRAVNGLAPVVRGAARVYDGERMVEVGGADAAALRRIRTRRVAMVFQQFALLPWRSVAENVALGLEAAGVDAEARRARVARQLEMVGLEGWGGCRVGELSGGMQQRVGLARALATESPILLMDEPFSALDPLIRVHLQDELLALQRSLRRTILFVSHDLDEALRIGNRIVIMEGGRIVQTGTPREIVLSPASAYVEEFVAHTNLLKVLRAGDVMRAGGEALGALGEGGEGGEAGGWVGEDAPLVEVLRRKREGAEVVRVRGGDGAVVGVIAERDVYAALLRRG